MGLKDRALWGMNRLMREGEPGPGSKAFAAHSSPRLTFPRVRFSSER